MSVCAVIAEYNPFHKGHEYHLKATREILGNDTSIIAIMSGSFVQRGDFAIMSRHARAQSAVAAGADLVIQLPVPYCLSSAERFAKGGVRLASSLGVVTHLSFGCETGDIAPLSRIADVVDAKGTHDRISDIMSGGTPYAAAREMALKEILPDDAGLVRMPNNILAVEYLRALRETNGAILPVAVKRRGALHDGEPDGGFASASFIRKLIREGSDDAFKYLPLVSSVLLRSEIDAKHAPVLAPPAEKAILAVLRSMNINDIKKLADSGEGLAFRLLFAIQNGRNIAEILALAGTKRYTSSRIRRLIMSAYLRLPGDLADTPPAAALALAFNRRGRELLAAIKESGSIPILTTPSQAYSRGNPARDPFLLEAHAEDMYVLAYPSMEDARCGSFWRMKPVFCDF